MLAHLALRDFVIVDALELEFRSGFTVLTGETGAGKSILVDALGLLLGERADAGVVREGRERAELTAEFDIRALPAVADWLAAQELTGDPGVCLIRRQIDASGRSRAFINGLSATLQQLREVGEMLVDIQGQHAHLSLLKAAARRELLDTYAGHGVLAAEVAQAYKAWQVLARRREVWEKDSAAFAAEREMLEWQVKELEALQFSPEEWESLQAEHGRLAHAASLLEGARLGVDGLADGDGAVLSLLAALLSRLQGLTAYDTALAEPVALVESAEVQLQEAAHALRRYADRLDLDPERLEQCEQRLQVLHTAARKYRVVPETLPEALAERRARLAELGGEGSGETLREEEAAARNAYLGLAERLSAGRRQAAAGLSAKVSETIQTLALAGGRFEVALVPEPEGAAYGLEQVDFLVAAHGGMTPRPLEKVASGGELSRISLAVQVAAQGSAQVATLVFDEVDVGIGGGVAEIVGKLLRGLGAGRQVLCITHLPQVAALGEHHLRVSKGESGTGVQSRIETLSPAQRVDEIARMLGGVSITDTTRRHAAEMLGLPV